MSEKNQNEGFGVTFTGNVTFNGPMFDIHDNEVVNLSVDKAKVTIKDNDNHNDNLNLNFEEGLLESLKPIFYNNEDDVRLFLKKISGMKPNSITDLVNIWVKDKRISDYGSSRKGDLWKILYDAGLYTKTRQNWNRRVE